MSAHAEGSGVLGAVSQVAPVVVVRRAFGLVPTIRRRRRASDVVRTATAVVLLSFATFATDQGWRSENRLVEAVADWPGWVVDLCTWLFWGAAVAAVVVVVLAGLVGRRPVVLRDIGLTLLISGVVVVVLRAALGSDGGRPDPPAVTVSTDFPVLLVALATAAVAGAAPYLTRPARRSVYALMVVVVLTAIPAGEAVVLSLVAALLVGWGAGAVVHLVVGSPAGFPSPGEIADGAETLRVRLDDVHPLDEQRWGVARFRAADQTGAVCDVAAYGRDATDAQLIAKAWRFAIYRDTGPSLSLTRLQQVEHEAVATLLAQGAGASVPEVLAVGLSPLTEDALLVTRRPAGRTLAEVDPSQVDDGVLDAAWAQLSHLRAAGVAHGAIDPWHVLVDDDGAVSLVGFESASTASDEALLQTDEAGLLVTSALVAGVERAAAAAVRAVGADRVGGMLSQLQAPALSPATRDALVHARRFLADLRSEVAQVAAVDEPPLAELRRVSAQTVLMVAGTALGFWLLVSQLAGLGDIWSTIAAADWVWVALAFPLSQLTQVCQGYALNGAVQTSLPFLPVVMMQFGTMFTGLVGGTVANTAAYVRFFQGRGLTASVAVSSGVTVSGANFLVQAILLLTCLPLVKGDFDLANIGSGSGSSDGGSSGLLTILIIAIIVIGVVAGAAVLLPRLRKQVFDRVRPQLQAARNNLSAIFRDPRKMLRMFVGNASAQILYALVIGLCLKAYGESASLAALIVINTCASLFGGLAPVPGGMGVVEASLIAGLTAYGIPATPAAAAVFTARLMTTYLPPAWGYLSLVWLRKRDYL